VPAIVSFGCIHTNHPDSVVEQARHKPLPWDHGYLFTGMSAAELADRGVRPGLRVVLAASRRVVTEFGRSSPPTFSTTAPTSPSG